MTSFLRLNGIAVPVAHGGTTNADLEFIGKNVRSIDGSMVAGRRNIKGKWRFASALRTAAESLAFRDLIVGRGHVLSFDAQNSYTSKGMAPVSVAAGWGFSTSGPKYGAACASWTTGNALWSFFTSSSPWTLAWWVNESAAGWHHYVQNSAGTKWIDGVLAPGGSMLGFGGVASGVATFGSVTASKIDDIVALPYLTPADWPAQLYGFGSAFGLLPALTADGDFIEQNSSISVLGGEPTGKLFRGATVKNLHDFGFELFER